MKVRRTMKMKVQRFEVGDVIRFKLTDGEKVEAIAVKQVGSNMLFIHTDCLKKEYPMYDEYNEDGYGDFDSSDLRKYLNSDILSRYPRKIRKKMAAFDNGDMLRLPTEKEIFGINEYGKEEGEEVVQFECMKKRKHRIAFQGYGADGWEWYWLENRHKASASSFCYVYSYGSSVYGDASGALGVRPLFLVNNL